MIPAQVEPISFEKFLEWYPEDGKRYELIEGAVVSRWTQLFVYLRSSYIIVTL